MADPTNQAPLATPWWESGVQVNMVLAAVAQIVSITLRILGRFVEIHLTDQDLQLLFADLSQVAAIVFGIIAIVKRQTSTIQPLTLTAKGAEAKSQEIAAKASQQ